MVGVQIEGRRERVNVRYHGGFGEDGRGGEEDQFRHIPIRGRLYFCILSLWGRTGLIISVGFLFFLSESNHLHGSQSHLVDNQHFQHS